MPPPALSAFTSKLNQVEVRHLQMRIHARVLLQLQASDLSELTRVLAG